MIEEEVQVILEGLDENSISSILSKWKEISEVKKRLEEIDEALRNKVKIYLKERKWDRYLDDESGISITITKMTKESFDKKQLALMLSEAQLEQITQRTTFEKLSIITPEGRARLKKYARKKETFSDRPFVRPKVS